MSDSSNVQNNIGDSAPESIYYNNNECSSLSVDFMRCNNVLSIIIFLLVFLVLFIFLFYIISFIIINAKRSGKSVHLTDGMLKGNEHSIIKQDPKSKDSKTINISENQTQGLEYTWSLWLYINEVGGNYQNIFVKGDVSDISTSAILSDACEIDKKCKNRNNLSTEELQACDDEELDKFKDCIYKINSPGLYITPNNNELLFVFNTFENIYETIKIDNVPLKKAIHIVIKCVNKTVSVLFNGSLVKQKTLLSLPKQNYYDVHIAANGGFNGYIADLWYYNYNIGFHEINQIYNKGPNTKLIGGTDVDRSVAINAMNEQKENNYLSYKWFF